MSYLEGPFRPRWFKPLAIAWGLMGLPVAIIVPIFWITGVSPTETPPPPPEEIGLWLIEVVADLVVLLWVFGTPILLFLADRKYRRLLRQSDHTEYAQN